MPGFNTLGETALGELPADLQEGSASRFESEIENDPEAQMTWLVELYPKQVSPV